MRHAIGNVFLITNLIFSTLLFGQITVPNGYYSGTWAGDTTYVVTGDVYVNHGQTLTIGAGAVIKFQGNYMMRVEGSLFANGTVTDSIIFEPYDANATSDGQWGGLKFLNHSYNQTSKVELSYFRTSYGGNGSWPNGAVAIHYKQSDQSGIDSIMISHGLIHNSSDRGVWVYNNGGYNYNLEDELVPGGKPYIHLSNLHIHSNSQHGIDVENNYDSEIRMDSLNVHDNAQHGVDISYNYNGTRISIDSLRSVENSVHGLYIYRLENNTKLKVRNADIHDNDQYEVNVSYIGMSSKVSVRKSKIEDNQENDNYYVIRAYDCCDVNDTGLPIHTLDFRENDWGTTLTATMNSGTNPQDLERIYDYYSCNWPSINFCS